MATDHDYDEDNPEYLARFDECSTELRTAIQGLHDDEFPVTDLINAFALTSIARSLETIASDLCVIRKYADHDAMEKE